MRILTIDLGTSATKAALWSEDGPIAMGRAPVDVEHPRPGWVEQDPEAWWTSTLAACRAAPCGRTDAGRRRRVLHPTRHVRPRDDGRRAHRPGDRGGGPPGRRRRWPALGKDFHVLTGVVPDAGTVAAKVAWIRRHEPDRLSGGQRWILGAERPDRVPADRPRHHRRLGGVTDRPDRPRRRRARRRGAPPGDRRPDDDRRRRPPARRRPPSA